MCEIMNEYGKRKLNEGRKDGKKIGKEIGKEEQVLKNLKQAIQYFGVGIEEVLECFKVPKKDWNKYRELLTEKNCLNIIRSDDFN